MPKACFKKQNATRPCYVSLTQTVCSFLSIAYDSNLRWPHLFDSKIVTKDQDVSLERTFKHLGVWNKVKQKVCFSWEWSEFIFLAVVKVPALFSPLLRITGGHYRSPLAVSMSNMKQCKCQQCNIACSSQLFDQSNLNWKCCWLNSDDFVLPAGGNMKKEKWPREKTKWKMHLARMSCLFCCSSPPTACPFFVPVH